MDVLKIKRPCLLFIILGFIIFVLIYATQIRDDLKSRGILTLTFDDGLKSQYEIAFKEMQKYNYKGTLFLLANWSGLFEGRELMNFSNAKEMQDYGWEIGSHTLDHKNLLDLQKEKIKEELEKSKEILSDEGFKINTLSFPFGSYSEEVIKETKKYYLASRTMKNGYNSIQHPNFYELKSKAVMKKHSSKEVCSWIKEANRKGLWLILIFHNIGIEQTPWDCSEQKFKDILECIKNEGIVIKTIKEVLENEKRN